MAKQINFTYKDTDYTLEFDRKTAVVMEKQGFDINEVQSKPNTMIPMLIRGAFIMHHRSTKSELIDEIYDSVGDKSSLLTALIEMYGETITALVDDNENKGNLNWTANW